MYLRQVSGIEHRTTVEHFVTELCIEIIKHFNSFQVPQVASKPEKSNNRMVAMEHQLANLTGIVNSGITPVSLVCFFSCCSCIYKHSISLLEKAVTVNFFY